MWRGGCGARREVQLLQKSFRPAPLGCCSPSLGLHLFTVADHHVAAQVVREAVCQGNRRLDSDKLVAEVLPPGNVLPSNVFLARGALSFFNLTLFPCRPR